MLVDQRIHTQERLDDLNRFVRKLNEELKVQAHVTICMLSLLLQKALKRRLREANMSLSASACREILQTCHLNLMKPLPGGQGYYSVTEATTAQTEVLKTLNLSHLVDDRTISGAATPRFVST